MHTLYASATSPSHEGGDRPHWVRLQSKELKGQETHNREDGQIKKMHRIYKNPFFVDFLLLSWERYYVYDEHPMAGRNIQRRSKQELVKI